MRVLSPQSQRHLFTTITPISDDVQAGRSMALNADVISEILATTHAMHGKLVRLRAQAGPVQRKKIYSSMSPVLAKIVGFLVVYCGPL